MTDSDAARLAAYWTQFGRQDLHCTGATTSALIARRRRTLAEAIPFAEAWSVLPHRESDQLVVIAGQTLFRLRSLDGGESVERHRLTDAVCDLLSAGETTHEEATAFGQRRWRLRLPDDGFEFVVDDPDTALLAPQQVFARTIAHRLGHRGVDL